MKQMVKGTASAIPGPARTRGRDTCHGSSPTETHLPPTPSPHTLLP
ncbi:hypothetical protein HMPREF1550_02102 [Actinomyces sp. oral taxon 877 str. F0543]|nr:hypothetical protein HMPREF1550_02102 [Actinomyces sp. oral taxon 877 str. F0543]